jgi:phosphoglycolate phosphatase-like HAD superfamily hydrolase
MLFLFDIDGTLIGTHGAGMRALERAVADRHGREGAARGVRADGKTDPAIVVEIFERIHGRAATEAEIAAILERYLTHLDDEVARSRYQVMPGVAAALDAIEARGLPLGLATGNVERGAEIKLRRGDLWRHFAFGGYGSDAAERGALVARAIERAEARAGRAIARADIWVIGDTPRDIAAARACGVRAIGVATGPHRPDALRDADLVWETLEELPGWLGS